MEEEVKVEEVVEELPEEKVVEEECVYEEGEKYFVVKTEEFLNDYHALEEEKEVALIKGLEELDRRVQEKLEALRPEIVEAVKEEIKKEIDEEYDEKIKFYERYVEEVVPAPETVEELKEVEEELAEEQPVQPEEIQA